MGNNCLVSWETTVWDIRKHFTPDFFNTIGTYRQDKGKVSLVLFVIEFVKIPCFVIKSSGPGKDISDLREMGVLMDIWHLQMTWVLSLVTLLQISVY